ncbi:hypothetical protein G6F56_011880 [Rhizopus delemar]|nr:hypothetical protein G6F56_011880 [Rhizopus delemar]
MEIEYTLLPVPTFSYESLDMIDDTEPFCSIVLDKQPFSKASNDPFVTHKTTQRDMYDEARKRTGCDWHATLDQPFDVILWNSKGHVTESSIANIAVKFQKDDKTIWKTPRVESGLLPGVFRSFLLLNHDIIQDDITIQELKQAHEVS